MKSYFEIFVTSAVLCLLITPLVISAGHRFRIYGRPRDGRKREALPRLGGLAIFFSVVLACAVMRFAQWGAHQQTDFQWATLMRLWLPATLVLLAGIYDDIAGASPSQKLLVEFLAACTAWRMGIRIVALPVLGYPIHSLPLSFLLTTFWMLAATNGLNLIDGLDGLAAGVAFFATLAMFIVALIQGDSLICMITITFAGALLGFLWFNSVPAKIFLGDTGSLFLGFLLGALAVYTTEKSSTLLALAVPYLAFGVPLLDTSIAVVRRFLSARPIFGADHEHLHHKLAEVCASPRLAVAALYGLAALFSIGSLLIVRSTQNVLVLVIVLGGITVWFLASRVQYEELTEFAHYLGTALRLQRRVLANQILIRKAAKNLEKTSDLEKSWDVLTRTFCSLDFDEVRCRLEDWPEDLTPVLPAWRSTELVMPGQSWSTLIPLHAGGRSVGMLQLRRSLRRGRMLLQFSSVLDVLIPAFEKRLSSEYEIKSVSADVKYSVPVAPHLERSLVANSRGGV